ncbi:DUF421 domain-containing protein [Cohnella lubricantis]|uniref:DUF421 domain-containing protein n=1 Tax=Cohnella lubricantis TaxID=2163172 RepID=A0A841T9K3_9BACL|nr:DUF421 domain-containing protein [Cohnella lubricantis]MBB6677642.1 DUF421 domain-containing protein [Cohnella lubricantis]MBP2116470.1 uncharacterized membrane protein YcaP (DUF421 family) [Cohnella lubricantis]
MELTVILLRTVFMYLFVFLVIRLMGKREIGKLSVFDMVISIMIAEIAVISIESTERSMWATVGPIVVLVAIQLAISYITLRNRKIRLWFDGHPSVLIREGQLNWREMRRQRYNLDDLLTQLRENKISNVKDIELAVLESNGKLSVIPKAGDRAESQSEGERPAKQEAAPRFRYEILPVALVMDGKVQDDGLEQIGKNRFWLMSELRERGIRSFDQVFYCSMDHKGQLYIDRKS